MVTVPTLHVYIHPLFSAGGRPHGGWDKNDEGEQTFSWARVWRFLDGIGVAFSRYHGDFNGYIERVAKMELVDRAVETLDWDLWTCMNVGGRGVTGWSQERDPHTDPRNMEPLTSVGTHYRDLAKDVNLNKMVWVIINSLN